MSENDSSPEPEEPTYEVESINEARITQARQWEYNIKWGGYSESENSWEPESNLTGCRRMMKKFWQEVGAENKAKAKRLPVGYKLFPPTFWIRKERQAYKKSAAKRRSKVIESDSGSSSGVSDTSKEFVPPASSDDSEEDAPLKQKASLQTRPYVPKISTSFGGKASSSKRKLHDSFYANPPQSPPSKRSKTDSGSNVHEKAPTATINTGAEITQNLRLSPLFGDDSDSDSDETPLASTSPKATLAVPSAPQPSGSQLKHSIPRQIPSVDTPKPRDSLPAHRQRQLNPRVKSMSTPASASKVSGIPTKARIMLQGVTGSRLMGSDGSRVSTASGVAKHGPTSTNPPVITQPRVSPQELDVDNWLKENILLRGQAARRTVDDANLTLNEPSLPNSSTSAQQGLHFSKRWRWTGLLCVGDNEADDGLAESMGNIVLTDNTPLDTSAGQVGIQLLLPSTVDSLYLRYQYPIAAFDTVLADFRISQFACMTADGSEDGETFKVLVNYMTKHEMFSQSPLSNACGQVATIFVFPASLEYLWDRIRVPPRLRQTHGLLVAIGFQAYKPPVGSGGGSIETYHSNWKADFRLDVTREAGAPELFQAMLTLDFPEGLFKRISQKECVIFTTPNDRELVGDETMALTTIMRNAPGCKIVSTNTGSARYIFIHLSAWNILHKLPGLTDRRLRRPDIQFFTYGSDATVERKRWGIREIFPMGGVVTFTPRAIAEDPDGIERLIARLDEHPFWVCYLLPSVLAMVVEIADADSGPDSKLKNAIQALCGILTPLEKGQIALSWHPPSRLAMNRDSNGDLSPSWHDWLEDQVRLSKLGYVELLQECQRRFQRQDERSEKDVEGSIVRDMLVMQSELREEYRRFVIITDTCGPCNTSREEAAAKSSSTTDVIDGFELTHVDDFTFGDDYPFVTDRI